MGYMRNKLFSRLPVSTSLSCYAFTLDSMAITLYYARQGVSFEIYFLKCGHRAKSLGSPANRANYCSGAILQYLLKLIVQTLFY